MGRKKKHAEHVNHERWLVSWADFMTLLFALFTALYAISTADPKKAGAMAESTRAAFKLDITQSTKVAKGNGNAGKPNATAPKKPTDDAPDAKDGEKPQLLDPSASREARQLQSTLRKLQEVVPTLPLTAGLTVKQTKNTIVISLKDKAFFHRGSAQLLSPALPVLDKLATVLIASGMYLRVEGHTDDRPTHSHKFVSNWDLSAARAVSVVQYLADEYAYPPEAMAVAGYASGRPVVANDSDENRSINRRVDIVLLAAPDPSPLHPHVPPPAPAPGPAKPANAAPHKK